MMILYISIIVVTNLLFLFSIMAVNVIPNVDMAVMIRTIMMATFSPMFLFINIDHIKVGNIVQVYAAFSIIILCFWCPYRW